MLRSYNSDDLEGKRRIQVKKVKRVSPTFSLLFSNKTPFSIVYCVRISRSTEYPYLLLFIDSSMNTFTY